MRVSTIPFLFIAVLFAWQSANGQAGSEIYLFDLQNKAGQPTISNGRNITNHKGYDNQPYFHPSKPLIYYSSFDDSGRSDIKIYDFESFDTRNLTVTPEREYSPTVTPDGKFISCIIQRDNGAQDLCKIPIGGGKPEILINSLKIGYHAWMGKEELLLFVLGDSNNHRLHYYHLGSGADSLLATNIGRSLHKIPNQDAMSFVQRINEKETLIRRINNSNLQITTLVPGIQGLDHLAWAPSGHIIMSDGLNLYIFSPHSEVGWRTVAIDGDKSMLKGITRLAINPSGNKIAVVVSE